MTKVITDGNNVFSKTSKISGDYQVWNIPSLGEGIVPLFESASEFQVNTETLKYIKVESTEAKPLRIAASNGIRTLAQVQSILNSKRTGPTTLRNKAICEIVLPIFEKYTK